MQPGRSARQSAEVAQQLLGLLARLLGARGDDEDPRGAGGGGAFLAPPAFGARAEEVTCRAAGQVRVLSSDGSLDAWAGSSAVRQDGSRVVRDAQPREFIRVSLSGSLNETIRATDDAAVAST